MVKAGVVGGSFFDVMGLRPVLGRLLNAQDDGPKAAGAAVLTHRFWTTSLNSDPTVIGKTIRLGPRTATVVGVLEPSVPYPADTEIIANVVTSPHHLGATMVTSRTHRMTELFGRLAPGASLEAARAELTAVHAAMMREHPEAYSPQGRRPAHAVTTLRDQIAAPARTILLVLLAAAAVVFVIACSNVANLILARSVRREGELAVRAALGAGRGALRRTLLAESLVLCGAGAVLGVVLAQPLRRGGRPLCRPLLRPRARRHRRCQRALGRRRPGDGRGGAARVRPAAAVAACARRPRPGERQRPDHAGHQPPPAGVRDDADCVLVRAARRRGHAARHARRPADGEHRLRHAAGAGIRHPDVRDRRRSATRSAIDFYQEATRRIGQLPGVDGVAVGSFVPWRDAGSFGPGFQFAVEGYTPAQTAKRTRARGCASSRLASSRVLGVPMLAGRDFTDDDRARQRAGGDRQPERRAAAVPERRRAEPAHVVDRSVTSASRCPRRIVGVVADVDDENVVPGRR